LALKKPNIAFGQKKFWKPLQSYNKHQIYQSSIIWSAANSRSLRRAEKAYSGGWRFSLIEDQSATPLEYAQRLFVRPEIAPPGWPVEPTRPEKLVSSHPGVAQA
jgi:hypothetical protein